MRFDLCLVLVYFILAFLHCILIPLYQLGHTSRKMMGHRLVNGVNPVVNDGKPLFLHQQMANLLQRQLGVFFLQFGVQVCLALLDCLFVIAFGIQQGHILP